MATVAKTDNLPNLVVVHPLVLLSAVDHYNRVAKDAAKKRVVGVLLGTVSKGTIDVTNSYAVPFEEDEKNAKIWFLDHNYHEAMWQMFKKVSARERVVGWYSTGPKIRQADLEINEVFRRYTPNPVFVIIDVQMHEVGIPTKGYSAVEEVLEDGTVSHRFQHIPSVIDALEAEEVGVEHLLRDVKDTNISTLATQINDKVLALKSLIARLEEMHQYLTNVVDNKLPINHTIVDQIQEIFNLLPNLNQESLMKAFHVQTNDMMLVIYLASLIRSVVALHNLINNKLDYKRAEESLDSAEADKKTLSSSNTAADSNDKNKKEPSSKK